LKLASLPPLTMVPLFGEKEILPCIMITPSTPIHETDFEIHYFPPVKRQSGFFGHIRDVFSFTPTHSIALSNTSDTCPYGQTFLPSSRWPAMKRFRAFLLMMAAIFIAVHLFVLPLEDDGLYRVFQGHRGGYIEAYPSAIVWEGPQAGPMPSDAVPSTSGAIQDAIATITKAVAIPTQST